VKPSQEKTLFESLFDFHPRENHSPRENFLTESFAYFLKTEPAVRRAWLSKLLGREVADQNCTIATRPSESDEHADRHLFPDLVLDGTLANGELFSILCEHKWDSPCNKKQLADYRKLASNKGAHAKLVFVGSTLKQKQDAESCFKDHFCRCFLWEDAFAVLERIESKSSLLKEFLDFMKVQGLCPVQPLSAEILTERNDDYSIHSSFIKHLAVYANKLKTNFKWDEIIPIGFQWVEVHNRWGRVGIRFEAKDFKPAITLGFLYDVTDHKVELVDSKHRLDLMLRLEAYPKDTKDKNKFREVENLLKEQRQLVHAGSALLQGEPGNGNLYSVLIVQESLWHVIRDGKTADEQIQLIYEKLHSWLQPLFHDGKLEKALKKWAKG